MIWMYRGRDLISRETVRVQWMSAPWWLKPALLPYWAVCWFVQYFVAIVIIGWLTAVNIAMLVALVYIPLFRPPPLLRKIAAWIIGWF
jgi:hypothetical protein